MTLIIAGERSGVGKTTITLAILAFLAQKQAKVQSFKVGPDYIDPMFHSQVTGRPCRNLDPILTSEAYVQSCFARHCQGADYALIEGVMGLFDGVPFWGVADYASTAHIARLLKLSVILVVDCSRLSGSVAALICGYREFHPQVNLAGVIFNRVGSSRHLTLLQAAIAPLKVTLFGAIYRNDALTLGDRHLGLIPTDEINNLADYFQRLAELAQTSLDWEKLLPLLQCSHSLEQGHQKIDDFEPFPTRPTIAIARDAAFNFYYQDNLDLLQDLGAELIPFSPLHDQSLPARTQGLYLGGGFPEVFAAPLSQNSILRGQLQQKIRQGMPVYAECGGLMYLGKRITDLDQKTYAMVGILTTESVMAKKLTLGYRQATVMLKNTWVPKKQIIHGHEFHRSVLKTLPSEPLFHLKGLLPQDPITAEGWCRPPLHASYLHLHFGTLPDLPRNFIKAVLHFSNACVNL